MKRRVWKTRFRKSTIAVADKEQDFKKELRKLRRKARTLPNYYPMPGVRGRYSL